MSKNKFLSAVVLGMILTFFATPGIAHTELTGSNPSANSLVDTLPSQLVLNFSEAPLEAGTFVRLEQQGGERTSKIGGKSSGSSMRFDWPDSIRSGAITVYWRAVADDGHIESGDFKFFYKAKAMPSSTQTPGQQNSQMNQIVARAAIVMLFVLAIGIIVTSKRRN